MKKDYDFSKGKRGPVVPNAGKTRITIWVDNSTLEWFKEKAESDAVGYQTAINQALRNYIQQDQRPIQEIVKEAVKEGLKEIRKAG